MLRRSGQRGWAPRQVRAGRIRSACVLAVFTVLLSLVSGVTMAGAMTQDIRAQGSGARTLAWPGEGSLSVTITSFSPDAPSAADRLRVRGEVSNVSEVPVRDVRAVLRISPTVLVGRAEIAEVLTGETTREGLPVTDGVVSLADELAGGATVPFEISVQVAALRLSTPGAYVTTVEALGDQGNGLLRQSMARTFLPWWPEATRAGPIGLNVLWPLTGPPHRDGLGVFLDEALAVDMSATGRLDTLLRAARRYPAAATLLVDPQVTQAASVMAKGYEVYTDPLAGVAVRGTRSKEVAQWLSVMRAAAIDPATRTASELYGGPDLDAAQRGHALPWFLSQRRAVQAQTTQELGNPLGQEIAVAPQGNLTTATLDTLVRRHVPMAVLTDLAMPATQPLSYTPTGASVVPTASGDLPVLLRDAGLDETLAMPAATSADLVAMRQRLLAETITAALELPNSRRVLVTMPPMRWAPTDQIARAVLRSASRTEWIRPRSIGQARRSGESGPQRTHLEPGEVAGAEQLPADYVKSVRVNQRGVTTYRGMVSDPQTVDLDFQQAPSRQLSSWLGTDPTTRDTLAKLVGGQVSQAVDSVSIISSGSVTISGSSGMIPVTVANEGPTAVTVGLVLRTANPALFRAEDIEPFRIEPGRRRSKEVQAHVLGSRNIPVEIQLVTAEGRDIGEPQTLIVRSTAYARTARVIVQVSLAMLVLAVLIHGVRRARRARRADPGGPGE